MHVRSGCRKQLPEDGRLKFAGHLPVRNTGIQKFVAMCNKTMALIEADGLRLRVEAQRVITTLARTIDQEFKDGGADAMAPPIGNYRHSPDMSVW